MNLKIYSINLINMSGIYDYIVQSDYKKESNSLHDKKIVEIPTVFNESKSSEINEIVKIDNESIKTNENLNMNDLFKSASYIITYMMDDYSTTLVDVVS